MGFLAFIDAEGFLSKGPDKQSLSELHNLVFQAGHVDSSSVFTRQAGNGELDASDPDLRSGMRTLAMVGSIPSQTLSAIVLTKQHQLPRISVKCGSRTLLYHRLII